MKIVLSIISVFINLIVFVSLFGFLMSDDFCRTKNTMSTAFFLMLEIGLGLDSLLILTSL